jgi:hypothetical protein
MMMEPSRYPRFQESLRHPLSACGMCYTCYMLSSKPVDIGKRDIKTSNMAYVVSLQRKYRGKDEMTPYSVVIGLRRVIQTL